MGEEVEEVEEVDMPAVETPPKGPQSSRRNLITQPSRSCHGPDPSRNLSNTRRSNLASRSRLRRP